MLPLSWCEIHRPSLVHNLTEFASLVGGLERLLPVIKADAYGHGMLTVAQLLVEEGVRQVGVNDLDEALALKARHPGLETLVLGFVPPRDMQDAVAAGVQVVAYRADVIEALSAAAQRTGGRARVHLKLETGNHRQGLEPSEALALARRAASLPGLELVGASTHFADIEDTTDPAFARRQLDRFRDAVAALRAAGFALPVLHCANTAATLNMPETYFDLARVGIGLYGLWPSQETYIAALLKGRVRDLKPVLTWKARIAQLKTVKRGGYIGYGRSFRATSDLKLAILPIGYYDGYDRRLSNMAYSLIRGQRAPVRGRICMNMTMIDVTDVDGVNVGDEVVLLGVSGEERVRAEDLAALIGTIHYEVVTRIHSRIPRILTR